MAEGFSESFSEGRRLQDGPRFSGTILNIFVAVGLGVWGIATIKPQQPRSMIPGLILSIAHKGIMLGATFPLVKSHDTTMNDPGLCPVDQSTRPTTGHEVQ